MSEADEALAESLYEKGIAHSGVIEAIASTPRDHFVTESCKPMAHVDRALPIECDQTISQPFVVARMTELLLGNAECLDKILEIGTGSGYQAAVLAKVAKTVYSIERFKLLFEAAKIKLTALHLDNIHLKHGDGYLGWPEKAPFSGIIVTAAPTEIPEALLEQLSPDGGRLIIPVGANPLWQDLILVTRKNDAYSEKKFDPVVFVPMLPGVSER